MKVALFYIFLFTTTMGWSQNLKYDILYNGKDVGNLDAVITRKGNTLNLDLVSKVVAKVIITVEVKYTIKVKYVNDELYSSTVITYLNGNVRSSMQVVKKNGYYLVNEDGDLRKFYGKITISDGILCIVEPKYVDAIFSEFDAINKPIKKTANGRYTMSHPRNSNHTDYIYKDGVLQQSTVHYTLATFVIRKK